ncbi:hypothetical protein ACFLXP_04480 [Chloroflexota bacterium]
MGEWVNNINGTTGRVIAVKIHQAKFGRPENPGYLLKHNEFLSMFRGFRCLRYHEGIVAGLKAVAGIISQKV